MTDAAMHNREAEYGKIQEDLQMEKILQERALIEKDDGTVELTDVIKHMTQVFTSFASLSGAVRKSVDRPGLWEIFSPQIDPRTNQPVGVAKVYFRTSQVLAIGVPFESAAPKIQVVGAMPTTRPLNGGHR